MTIVYTASTLNYAHKIAVFLFLSINSTVSRLLSTKHGCHKGCSRAKHRSSLAV